jgi:endonuclease/exonuclease/phosphatase family metal-dependent hydrolase
MMRDKCWVLLFSSLTFPCLAQEAVSKMDSFSFDELTTLSKPEPLSRDLAKKLDLILKTPVVNGATFEGVEPRKPSVSGLGPILRVANWNIERGREFDLIRLAFSNFEDFRETVSRRAAIEPTKLSAVEDQAKILRESDVIILNEVDLGMKRTDYRDVAADLAKALHMNYAYGVEFVEVDGLEDLGTEPVALEDQSLSRKLEEELKPDPNRYRGLHGNAILSRYPLSNVRIVRLPACYDWFNNERAEISALEKGKRFAANKLFLERITREVRRGGRMALVADLTIPELPAHSATVVSAHLENKCKPDCRARQVNALLDQLKDIHGPVIIGGDFNTTGQDGTPTSIRREIMERIKNYEFWAAQALKWFTPASMPLMALEPYKYFKNYLDPTSTHLPFVGPNREAFLFRDVKKFRFSDGRAFDYRGETQRNLHDREKTLANSNQRALKGFVPTFSMARDFGGLAGRYKLDWFFVSPYISSSTAKGMSYRFSPHFPITMRELNAVIPDGISDHAPMTVDLPFAEPAR